MKKKIFLTLLLCISAYAAGAQALLHSQWEGRKVAFLGDSITDANQIGKRNNVYWNNLQDILGIEAFVYGINGHRMNQIVGQAERLEAQRGQDIDAIMVFAGTNDFNGSVPLGEWYKYSMEVLPVYGGATTNRLRRTPDYNPDTFRGRINSTVLWLKTHYPDKQIIFLTPIHRAYAKFGGANVQPDESYANGCGYFIDDYVQAVKEIANVWAVPVIDLNAVSGLYPVLDEHTRYFRDPANDRLHPNTPGQLRMAWSIAYQMLGYPARFEKYVALNCDASSDSKAVKQLKTILKECDVPASYSTLGQWIMHTPLSFQEATQAANIADGTVIELKGYSDNANGAQQVRELVSKLKAQGFSFVTVEELIGKIYANTY